MKSGNSSSSAAMKSGYVDDDVERANYPLFTLGKAKVYGNFKTNSILNVLLNIADVNSTQQQQKT